MEVVRAEQIDQPVSGYHGSHRLLHPGEVDRDNLADLAEHAIQGNEVLVQQDLTVLQRSAENIRDNTSDVQQAAWTGFADGLQECLAD